MYFQYKLILLYPCQSGYWLLDKGHLRSFLKVKITDRIPFRIEYQKGFILSEFLSVSSIIPCKIVNHHIGFGQRSLESFCKCQGHQQNSVLLVPG